MVLLLAYHPVWTARLAGFGQAGRMALTNYMVQAAVLDGLASGYGFGLWLRPRIYVVGAALLFVTEAWVSRAWLARSRSGRSSGSGACSPMLDFSRFSGPSRRSREARSVRLLLSLCLEGSECRIRE